jgi:type I restriction enzyme S subunit
VTWEKLTLDDVCDLITCGVAKRPNYVDNGIPFLSAKNVKKQKIIWDDYQFISKETHSELTRHNKPCKGDILYTRVGSYGEAAIVDRDFDFSIFVSLTLIKPSNRILNSYLTYYLNSPDIKRLAKKSISGAGVGNLNVGAVRKFPILLPSLETQKKIVKRLDMLFIEIDKATMLVKANAKNADALYQSYLTEIFERGGKDWNLDTLGNYYDVRDGTHDSPKFYDDGYPLITSKNLKNGQISFEKIQFISEGDYISISQRSGVKKGDVLMGMIGTIGNPVVIETDAKFAIKNVALFKTNDKQSPHFLRYYLGSDYVTKKMERDAKGATQRFVGLGYLRSFPIKTPPFKNQLAVVNELDLYDEQTKNLLNAYKNKINQLEALKQSVLQQAFNGELVKE